MYTLVSQAKPPQKTESLVSCLVDCGTVGIQLVEAVEMRAALLRMRHSFV